MPSNLCHSASPARSTTLSSSWTLCNQVIINASEKLALLKNKHAEIIGNLEYYQFPFPSLPTDARNKLSKLFSNKSDVHQMERDHFRQIIECWRRSLLSLYKNLKEGKIDHFYYLQHELVILFQARDASSPMRAFIARASEPLMKTLNGEGIFFETLVTEHAETLPSDDSPKQDEENANSNDQSNVDSDALDLESPQKEHLKIKQEINDRLNRARRVQSRKRSVAASTLKIMGEGAVHCLVDFIINQKDGRSYVILPEMIAPGPFLHGTLSRSDYAIIGPIMGGGYQVKISGTLLPKANRAINELVLECSKGQGPFHISCTVDERTEPFRALTLL